MGKVCSRRVMKANVGVVGCVYSRYMLYETQRSRRSVRLNGASLDVDIINDCTSRALRTTPSKEFVQNLPLLISCPIYISQHVGLDG